MSVEITRQKADVCAAIFRDELNDFYGGTPFVEVVTIDDNFDITITYDITPTAQNLTDLDTLLAAHDCTLFDDEDEDPDGEVFLALNNSGVNIGPFTPVYITGWDATQKLATIAKSDASNSATMPAIGITCGITIEDTDQGDINTSGRTGLLDSSAWATNDELYVPIGGGTLTNVKPTGVANKIQKIATVIYPNATNGRLHVHGAFRNNDLPNITDGKVWMGDSNDVPQEVDVYTEAEVDALITGEDLWDDSGTTIHLSAAQSTDNVGIGNTSADEKLHVTGNIKGTAQAFLASGSTAVPAYSFTSDTNTGMYRESNGDIAFSQNGTCTFGITTSNKLIISNEVPNYETLVTADNVIPNKKYVDDKTWDASDIVSGTLANARISQGSVTQHEGAIDHDALSNFVINEHIDHSGVTLTAGEGLSGGGNITTSRTFNIDVNGLTADASPDGAADYVVTYDNSAGSHKKVLIDNLPSSGGGGITNSIYTLHFARDSSSGDIWLSHALTANGSNSPEYSNEVPAVIPFDSVLVGITFSNEDANVDCGVEIRAANYNSGGSDTLRFDWSLTNVRTASKTNGLSGVTFNAGDKVGVFLDDHGTNPDDAVVILYLQVTDSTTQELTENHSSDF